MRPFFLRRVIDDTVVMLWTIIAAAIPLFAVSFVRIVGNGWQVTPWVAINIALYLVFYLHFLQAHELEHAFIQRALGFTISNCDRLGSSSF